ncbi:MAG TPA: hypothetical protein VKP30_29600 [Polyangiaceae bacterium]|nr:hypothetical protein [Polyangiaceae bacterium]
MGKQFFFLGLLGIVTGLACTPSEDDGDGDSSSTVGGTKGSSTKPSTQNLDNNGYGGQRTDPQTNNGLGSTNGSTQNTYVPGTGGAQTLQINPNRQITPTEEQSIRASGCNAWAFEPEIYPSKLELVIDVSSSMNSKAPGTNRSKWEVTRDALIEAVPGVAAGSGLPANTAVGLMFYPNMINDQVSKTPTDANVCLNTDGETPMAVLGGNEAGTHRSLLRERLATVQLGRGTPTADAYYYVLDNTVLSPLQSTFPGDAYMLLITDGMPTLYRGCYNPKGQLSNLPGDEVVAAVDYAFNKGVKTFIVGSPGSEEMRPWLSMAAFMGATAWGGCNPQSENGPFCHMDMTEAPDFSEALRNGLNSVMSQISGCKFEIPATSADGTQTVDPEKIAPLIQFSDGRHVLIGRALADSASCNDGFRLLSSSMMELCKNTCNELRADSLATVQFIFGCSTKQITDDLGLI